MNPTDKMYAEYIIGNMSLKDNVSATKTRIVVRSNRTGQITAHTVQS